MDKEEKYLVEICNAFLHNNKKLSEPEKNIELQKLLKLAVHHNLIAVCQCVLHDKKSDNSEYSAFLNCLRDGFLDSYYLFNLQSECLNDLKKIFEKNKIRHIFFKGSVIREYYPIPEARVMGDIDVLIKPEDRNNVKKILEDAGFKCTAQNGPVFDYSRENVLVEVHTKIINEFGENAFSDAFERACFEDGNYTGTLDDNYHFAYLIAHIAHHFRFYGAGIRFVLDLAVFQTNRKIDMNNVFTILKNVNLDYFAKVILSVCYEWFGIGQKYIDDTQKTQEYLCRCGTFGSLQTNKGAVIVRRELEEGKSFSSFKSRLHLAFPSYSKLKDIPYIKFIDGKPWLTPYAWCYRFYFNLKNRKEFMKKTVNQLGDEETQSLAKEELAYFKEIGLL